MSDEPPPPGADDEPGVPGAEPPAPAVEAIPDVAAAPSNTVAAPAPAAPAVQYSYPPQPPQHSAVYQQQGAYDYYAGHDYYGASGYSGYAAYGAPGYGAGAPGYPAYGAYDYSSYYQQQQHDPATEAYYAQQAAAAAAVAAAPPAAPPPAAPPAAPAPAAKKPAPPAPPPPKKVQVVSMPLPKPLVHTSTTDESPAAPAASSALPPPPPVEVAASTADVTVEGEAAPAQQAPAVPAQDHLSELQRRMVELMNKKKDEFEKKTGAASAGAAVAAARRAALPTLRGARLAMAKPTSAAAEGAMTPREPTVVAVPLPAAPTVPVTSPHNPTASPAPASAPVSSAVAAAARTLHISMPSTLGPKPDSRLVQLRQHEQSASRTAGLPGAASAARAAAAAAAVRRAASPSRSPSPRGRGQPLSPRGAPVPRRSLSPRPGPGGRRLSRSPRPRSRSPGGRSLSPSRRRPTGPAGGAERRARPAGRGRSLSHGRRSPSRSYSRSPSHSPGRGSPGTRRRSYSRSYSRSPGGPSNGYGGRGRGSDGFGGGRGRAGYDGYGPSSGRGGRGVGGGYGPVYDAGYPARGRGRSPPPYDDVARSRYGSPPYGAPGGRGYLAGSRGYSGPPDRYGSWGGSVRGAPGGAWGGGAGREFQDDQRWRPDVPPEVEESLDRGGRRKLGVEDAATKKERHAAKRRRRDAKRRRRAAGSGSGSGSTSSEDGDLARRSGSAAVQPAAPSTTTGPALTMPPSAIDLENEFGDLDRLDMVDTAMLFPSYGAGRQGPGPDPPGLHKAAANVASTSSVLPPGMSAAAVEAAAPMSSGRHSDGGEVLRLAAPAGGEDRAAAGAMMRSAADDMQMSRSPSPSGKAGKKHKKKHKKPKKGKRLHKRRRSSGASGTDSEEYSPEERPAVQPLPPPPPPPRGGAGMFDDRGRPPYRGPMYDGGYDGGYDDGFNGGRRGRPPPSYHGYDDRSSGLVGPYAADARGGGGGGRYLPSRMDDGPRGRGGPRLGPAPVPRGRRSSHSPRRTGSGGRRSYSRSPSRSSRSRSRNRGQFSSRSRSRSRPGRGGVGGGATATTRPAVAAPAEPQAPPRTREEITSDMARVTEAARLAASNLPVGGPVAMGGINTAMSQLTRHARRVYVGSIPPNTSEAALVMWFNQIMMAAGAATAPGAPVIGSYMNQEKRFAFLEFRTVEECSNALAFDGVVCNGKALTVRRPFDFNPAAARLLGPLEPNPKLNLALLGVVNTLVEDGPNKLFVGGLPNFLTEEQVRELLAAFGPLKAFHLVMDRDTATSKGFGFCEYADPAVTEIAIQGLSAMVISGKALTVRKANSAGEPSSVLRQMIDHQQASLAPGTVGAAPPPATGVPGAPGVTPPPASAALGAAAAVDATAKTPPTTQPSAGAGATAAANSHLCVVRLANMVQRDELLDPEEYSELVADTEEVVAKYGVLRSVVVPRPSPEGLEQDPPGVGLVFCHYADPISAERARVALDGRRYGDSNVQASLLDTDSFLAGQLS